MEKGRENLEPALVKLTDRIAYLPHEPEVDRPMLAYIRGDRRTLAVDAGYSRAHVQAFYRALDEAELPLPDWTVLTHGHYDHTFGMCAIAGVSIAHRLTNRYLLEQKELARDAGYILRMKQEDAHFAREYAGEDAVNIVPADIEFEGEMRIDLGGVTAHIFHTASPHAADTVCVYIPEEGVLFLGDATSEDFFNNGYLDRSKLRMLMEMIEQTPCEYTVLSHCEPLKKRELLDYLRGLL
ncbi:MAG: MBL fold metallo-hydrolase [Christensenellales bacterium]|nr:MBL fold metallo-hydrolase [Christensenellales bacterium]